MARKRGRLDFNNEAAEIGKRHRAEKTGWEKERFLAIKLLLEGELEALEEKITLTLRNYWEDTSRVMSLFSNSYLRSELNDSKKTICLFH
jgi:hypothetical protein